MVKCETQLRGVPAGRSAAVIVLEDIALGKMYV
jgi:hypothetical protein